MDAAWILLVLTTSGTNVGFAPADGTPNSPVNPVRHTAYFAGQDDWSWSGSSASQSSTGPNGDRYAQQPQQATISRSAVGPPPSISERTQNAFTETGNTLREGVEATVRAANQQLSRGGEQMWDATRNAGAQFNREVQDWSGTAGRQVQSGADSLRTTAGESFSTGSIQTQSSNPFTTPAAAAAPTANSRARGSVAPPPWPSASNASASSAPAWPDSTGAAGFDNRTTTPINSVRQTDSGWTSIGTSIAAPPLLIPQLPPTTSNVVRAGTTTGRNGPNFPASATDRQPIHSVLAEPAAQTAPAANAADDWTTGWDNNAGTPQATIGRSSSATSRGSTGRNSDLVPLQPVVTATPDSKTTGAARTDDLWADTDPWPQSSQPPANAPAATTKPLLISGANNSPLAKSPATSPSASNPTNSTVTFPSATPAGMGASIAGAKSAAPTATGEQPPWTPMVVGVLVLAGSLAANLFLGMSYLDARQKYESLVRKTADTFRRTKTVAA